MTDEERELDDDELLGAVEGMEQIERSKRRRGYATFWHADNKSQGYMEVDAARDWAEEMNKQGCQIDIDTIQKNSEPYPDCLAEMDGEKIGVEVTELVCREAIEESPEIPRLEAGPHFLDQLAEQLTSRQKQPFFVVWNPDAFQEYLKEIVQKKDKRVKDRSLSKQFLLIVTDEPWLDETTLSKYLKTIKLQPPRNFDAIYIMTSYIAVFEVPLAKSKMRA